MRFDIVFTHVEIELELVINCTLAFFGK
jgi:hypothetical protein